MRHSVCLWGMSDLFSGINKFDLLRSNATKIKSKVVGVSSGLHYIIVSYIILSTTMNHLKSRS